MTVPSIAKYNRIIRLWQVIILNIKGEALYSGLQIRTGAGCFRVHIQQVECHGRHQRTEGAGPSTKTGGARGGMMKKNRRGNKKSGRKSRPLFVGVQ